MNRIQKSAVVVSSFVLASPAFAVLDVAPITAAQSDLLLAAGALLALGIAVWGAMKVARMFGGK
jgi:hypothetical protein